MVQLFFGPGKKPENDNIVTGTQTNSQIFRIVPKKLKIVLHQSSPAIIKARYIKGLVKPCPENSEITKGVKENFVPLYKKLKVKK